MTMPVVTVAPDVEALLRTYLRGVDLNDATERVFYGRPEDGAYPYVVIDGQIGGGRHEELPASSSRVQIMVYGSGRNATRAIADLVVAHLAAAVSVTVGSSIIDSVDVVGGPLFVPDRAAKAARYVITAVVATRHAAP
jgi:hypothetical protein